MNRRQRLARTGDVIEYYAYTAVSGVKVLRTSMVIDLTETTLYLQNGDTLKRGSISWFNTEGDQVR